MAGINGNDSTFDDEGWWLLRDVRALTKRYTKSRAAAEGLILDYAWKGGFRRFRWYQPKGERERPIDPRFWGVSRPEVGLHVPVDWDNSCTVYMRDEQRASASNDLLQEFLPPPVMQMPLVRLHRDEIFAMLRAAGFTPPEATPSKPQAPPAPAPAPIPAAPSAPAPADAPTPAPAPAAPDPISSRASEPDPEVVAKLKGLAALRMYDALRERYPQDGRGACDETWKEIARNLESIYERRVWEQPSRTTFWQVCKALCPNKKRKRRSKSVRR